MLNQNTSSLQIKMKKDFCCYAFPVFFFFINFLLLCKTTGNKTEQTFSGNY